VALSKYLDRVTCGDCLDVLRELPDCSVDAVITDPPYGISGPDKVRVRTLPGAPRHASGSSTLVDVGADWGAEDREVGSEWLAEVARVLRPGGSLVVFCSQVQWQETRDAAEAVGLQVRQPWYWCKTNPPPTPRDNMASAVEMGWWFRKPGGPVTWNGGHVCANWFQGPLYTATFGTGCRVHPMQKPAWLMERMVELWSNEGDTVLDPFAGSASAGVAAVSMGRHYIGIEIDPAHADAANRRLAHALRSHQPTLALEAAE
jgi:site-specific DNA-methyltransferase (adenine-specific)